MTVIQVRSTATNPGKGWGGAIASTYKPLTRTPLSGALAVTNHLPHNVRSYARLWGNTEMLRGRSLDRRSRSICELAHIHPVTMICSIASVVVTGAGACSDRLEIVSFALEKAFQPSIIDREEPSPCTPTPA